MRPSWPVTRVELSEHAEFDPGLWPATLPAVRQVLEEGLNLGPLTVLVGENGSGKSTLIEGLATAYDLSPEGGSTGAEHSTRPSESDLGHWLRLHRGLGASRWGYFLRAETMHGYYTYLEQNPGRGTDPRFHELSHGESFLAVLENRFNGDGLYLLDEPESALSFTNCLALVGVLSGIVAGGRAQVVVATHSPVVAALPGATVLQLDDDGLHETAWEDLALVWHHRHFLDSPEAYLRHLRD